MQIISNPSATIGEGSQVWRTINRMVDHLKSRTILDLPTWVMYVILVLGLSGLTYGIVQQFRVWRLDKLQKAAQVRINELELDVRQTELRVKREFYLGKIKINEAEKAKIDEELKVIKNDKERIEKDANRMTPGQLRNAFRNESGPETRPATGAQKCNGGCK